MSGKLTLQEAREILARAVEKSREVQWISAYAVADEGGNIISISRLDGAPAAAVPLARSKAYLAALTGKTSMPFEQDVETHPVRFHGYQSSCPSPCSAVRARCRSAGMARWSADSPRASPTARPACRAGGRPELQP